MIIDNESFTQIALHVRRASDNLLTAARNLSDFSADESHEEETLGLNSTVESLVSMNEEFIVLEQLLRALWDANREEQELIS
jgi:hypothetical protein